MPPIPDELTTPDGKTVRIPDWTKEHLKAHPEAISKLEAVVAKLNDLPEDANCKEGDTILRLLTFDTVMGQSEAIQLEKPANIDDVVTWAFRTKRSIPTRVEVGRKGAHVNTMVAVLGKEEQTNTFTLYTTYAGERIAPRELTDSSIDTAEAAAEALEFWTTTALAYNADRMGEVFFATTRQIIEQYGSVAVKECINNQ